MHTYRVLHVNVCPESVFGLMLSSMSQLGRGCRAETLEERNRSGTINQRRSWSKAMYAAVRTCTSPALNKIAQQWPTCPGLIGSSLTEVARARRHSACTIQSDRSRDSPCRESGRVMTVASAYYSSQKPRARCIIAASATFAVALFPLLMHGGQISD